MSLDPGTYRIDGVTIDGKVNGKQERLAVTGGQLVLDGAGGCVFIAEDGGLGTRKAELPKIAADPLNEDSEHKGFFNRGSKAAPDD